MCLVFLAEISLIPNKETTQGCSGYEYDSFKFNKEKMGIRQL